jgi:hypothetical protein
VAARPQARIVRWGNAPPDRSAFGGSRVPIRSVADADVFDTCTWPTDVAIWDLHESDERDGGAIFAALKRHLVEHLLAHQGARRSSSTKPSRLPRTSSALAPGDLVRRGRHFALEVTC